jgi:hypothetical protein
MGLQAAMAKKVEVQKKEQEFIRIKMKEIASLPPGEQVKRLKQMVNDQQTQQKVL